MSDPRSVTHVGSALRSGPNQAPGRFAAVVRRTWGVIPVALIGALLATRAYLAPEPLAHLVAQPAGPSDPPGCLVYTGSLFIARAGPVIIGFQSRDQARLTVAPTQSSNALHLVGVGIVKDRLVLPVGPVAIRFAAPAGARLLWSPVGRRGDLEYVPASSLAPDPPQRAAFSSWAGTSPVDGSVAAAMVIVVVATLLLLARNRLAGVPRATWIAMAAVFVVACGVRLIGLGDQGQTWDEDVNWSAGRNYVTNLLALDGSADSWQWNYQHPPMMKLLYGIAAQFADGFGPARVLSAMWMSIAVALLVPIGTRLFNRRVGWLAGLIAAGLPPLVAHGQIVGHESPSLMWWMVAMVLALTVHDGQPGPQAMRMRLVWIGIAIGIAAASRFISGLVGPLCIAIVAVTAPPAQRWRTTGQALLVLPVSAAATLYAIWPWLWGHPWRAITASLAKLSVAHASEPFLGSVTAHPGPHYFIAYLGATLPAGIAIGVVAFVVRIVRQPDVRSSGLVAAWLAVPLIVAASPVRQDGVRYVLPCVAGLAVAAAAGFDFMTARWRRAVAPAAVAIAAYLAITLARSQPYYLDYFAEHVGGAGTVAGRGWFETAWWGEGLDRAVTYVNTHAAPGARVFRECIGPSHLAWFRGDLWPTMVRDVDQADWIISYSPTARRCPIPSTMRSVFAISADGALLGEVWQR